MKKILILGAGRSSSSLITYLLKAALEYQWVIKVGDRADTPAFNMCKKHSCGEAFTFNINDLKQCAGEVSQANLVISMLPARFHPVVAKLCLQYNVHFMCASYVSQDMKSFHDEAVKKNLLFLNECGLDPGIDHMSAMKVIDHIRRQGHELTAFESFTGGLLAPGTDADNPWEYKFTWNPRNVVLAGRGIVKFIQEDKFKYIPYHKVFRRTEQVFIPGYGYFEGYANRDSLKYLDVYNLRGISTIYRGTFRRPGFCRTWDIFVQLGATDDSYTLEGVNGMSHREFINSFLSYNPHDSVELKLAHYMNLELDGPEMHRLRWAGFFDDEKIGLTEGTPAQVLEHILKKKWTLSPQDKDMIVMWHKFEYKDHENKLHKVHSTLVATGEGAGQTAMAKTVGFPVGIAAKLVLLGKINEKGVHIPIKKNIYNPILKELNELGFEMSEEEIE